MYRKSLAAIGLCAALLAAPAAPAAPADVIHAHPVTWSIQVGHNRVTLFGSLHILPADMDWLTPDIARAVSRADVFVFEVPTDAPSQDTLNALIAKNGELPAGQSLRALLPPASQADYDTAIADAHLSPGVTDHEQPWLVSLQLSLADSMNQDYFPDAGVDYVLMSWANEHSRPVRYLETIDQQFALILPDDDGMELDSFETDLKQMDQERDRLGAMVQAWSDGDIAKLGTLIDDDFVGHPESRKRLLTDRNRKWAVQIEQMLKENRNVFITVGAAHLAGPDGVPALLRANGYDVEGP